MFQAFQNEGDPMPLDVKICGVTTPEAVEAAAAGGARLCRAGVLPAQPARGFAPNWGGSSRAGSGPASASWDCSSSRRTTSFQDVVGRVPLDLIQLHGDESPARVAEVRAALSMPVDEGDPRGRGGRTWPAVPAYADAADRLLFDAEAAEERDGAARRQRADFRLDPAGRPDLAEAVDAVRRLDAGNVAEAVRMTGARAVDVSSGVERTGRVTRIRRGSAPSWPRRSPPNRSEPFRFP